MPPKSSRGHHHPPSSPKKDKHQKQPHTPNRNSNNSNKSTPSSPKKAVMVPLQSENNSTPAASAAKANTPMEASSRSSSFSSGSLSIHSSGSTGSHHTPPRPKQRTPPRPTQVTTTTTTTTTTTAATPSTPLRANAVIAAATPPPRPPPETPLTSGSASYQKLSSFGGNNSVSSGIGNDIPLHRQWTLWYDNPKLAPNGTWKDCLKRIGSFDTVGLFWSMYNNIKPPSQLTLHSNYSVFRYGVEPMWEDPANVNGGKFVLTIPKKESRAGKCDEYWLFSVLAVIGETMDAAGDHVCGIVVSIRKSEDRIALWLQHNDREACRRLGERWKKHVLHLDGKSLLRYQTHQDAAASGRSFRNESQFQV